MLFWGLILPLAIAVLVFVAPLAALVLSALYPVQIARVALGRPCPRFSDSDQWRYATACLVGKIPNMQGQLRFWMGRVTGRRSALIEYKGTGARAENGSPPSDSASPRGSA
jgi:hypothetical protein